MIFTAAVLFVAGASLDVWLVRSWRRSRRLRARIAAYGLQV